MHSIYIYQVLNMQSLGHCENGHLEQVRIMGRGWGRGGGRGDSIVGCCSASSYDSFHVCFMNNYFIIMYNHWSSFSGWFICFEYLLSLLIVDNYM